ncbi:MAG: shikimate dehydrogenase [Candidatus Omnitrophica bacterium]|nr:shikimate dehydrogenase [Candidatus Omnitrophota bacterium]
MNTKHTKAVYGVIGHPVSHSFSAIMHNAAFKEMGIKAEYRLFSVEPPNLPDFMGKVRYLGIRGLNVTLPHKEAVIAFIDELSEDARAIGAVNTIVIEKDRMSGFNTDGAGFLQHLSSEMKFGPVGKAASIVGAGGAARALTYYLAKARTSSISLFDIDQSKCGTLARDMSAKFPDCDIRSYGSIADLPVEKSDLLINATPTGLHKDDPLIIDIDRLPSRILVYDLLYNPQETRLLREAKRRGFKVTNGLGMLLYQGVLAFEIWEKRTPPIETMRKALQLAIEKSR